jgi:hypothetical protein
LNCDSTTSYVKCQDLTPNSLIFINELTTIDEDIVVPFEIAFKYEAKGLKPADALIAAYTEWVGADALVTEVHAPCQGACPVSGLEL